MTKLIATRRASRVFSRGSIEFLQPANHRVLAYLREFDGEQILVVNNLSRSAQPVELDLRRHKGRLPIEMFGKTLFPRIGDLPYLLTLGPHQFYWFRLRRI
jgi:maltose alpha-D-glucosyltransferase/alpha-amylase